MEYDFTLEVYSAVELIITYPKAWPIMEGEVRRSLVKRFPYGILYTEEGKDIFVVAVMNLHREPGYWKYRIDKSDCSGRRQEVEEGL